MKKLIGYIIFYCAIIQIARAQQPGPGTSAGSWQIVGTTEARFTADHAGIVVDGPFNNFNHVKFKVTGNPLKLVKIVVTYGNGAPDNIEMLYNIPEGGESKVIDLRGMGERKVRRIDFWYDTGGDLNGKARVTVMGHR
jgi:allophanate hydrolase subunit 1